MLGCNLRAISRLKHIHRHSPKLTYIGTVRYLSVSTRRFTEIQNSFSKDNIQFEPGATRSDSNTIFTDGGSAVYKLDSVEVSSAVEPSFSSLGLGHGWPSGWMQSVMEFMHIDIGLPWWQAIGVTTICLRCVVAPIMVIARKNMVTLNEHQPTIQKLQVQAQLASVRGNHSEAAFFNKSLNTYMMANNCHPIKSMAPILVQAMFFTSMFFGLRGMTNVPVQSLETGGMLWFSNLTLADPTCILPVLTASTLFLQIYMGADGINLNTMPPFMKKLMFVAPLISVPVMIQFPCALNVYWLSNNLISLVQARVMRRKSVQSFLGIKEMTIWKPEELPLTNFHEELKREMAIQQRKTEKETARVEREKKESLEEERKRRLKLLQSFEEEAKKESENLKSSGK